MSLETFLLWIVVGLVAGVLASLVVGGVGFGIIGDIAIGIAGAFVGGWLFRALNANAPGGLVGSIAVAFVGACLLLLIIRLARGSRFRRA
ncbi:MAG: GlsB/YeaQ/YmgE family stress response membrane protein [Myxococcaceae bacterium]